MFTEIEEKFAKEYGKDLEKKKLIRFKMEERWCCEEWFKQILIAIKSEK